MRRRAEIRNVNNVLIDSSHRRRRRSIAFALPAESSSPSPPSRLSIRRQSIDRHLFACQRRLIALALSAEPSSSSPSSSPPRLSIRQQLIDRHLLARQSL